jgi:hypothetical protein
MTVLRLTCNALHASAKNTFIELYAILLLEDLPVSPLILSMRSRDLIESRLNLALR